MTTVSPARRPVVQRIHNGFAAIDFGTTSSTVTLFDHRYPRSPAPLDPAQASTMCSVLVALIRSDPPETELSSDPQRVRREWRDLVDRAAAEVLPGRSEPVGELVRILSGEPGRANATAYALLRVLDARRAGSSPAFSRWLAHELHRCVDLALAVPPVEHMRLQQVVLDPAAEDVELSSRLEVTGTNPLRVRLGCSLFGADRPVVTSLKHFLATPDERFPIGDGLEAGVDPLIGAAIDFLLQQADEFTAARPALFDTAPLRHVVLTYPTMAPPAVRRRLRTVACDALGLDEADLRYDEAIAASLFFLMRDIGPDHAVGIEALRGRFRAAVGESRVWFENVLVIDVGGGTTDIALITFRLDDATPELSDVDPVLAGRHYRIAPTLRGTTGRARRGGDFLTLQVFHWIKAILADRLLSLPADDPQAAGWENWQQAIINSIDPRFRDSEGRYLRGRLVTDMVDELSADTTQLGVDGRGGASVVRDSIEQVLPTRWVKTDSRSAFSRLWELAEEAKKQLGAGGSHRLAKTGQLNVTEVLTAALRHAMQQLPPVMDTPIELDHATFVRICRPMLAEVAELATGLVRARLSDTSRARPAGSTERLDRVILTGKASRLPLLGQVIRERFGGASERADWPADWRPDAIGVEWEYAKTATSIGAAWAASLALSPPTEADVRDAVDAGDTIVTVEVNNLFRNLPCAFSTTVGARRKVLLAAGCPLWEVGDGRTLARARIDRLPPVLAVEREVDGGATQMWGSLRHADLEALQRAAQPGIRLDRRVWPAEIRAEIEVDSELNLSLLLWRGERPHYRVNGDEPGFTAAGGPPDELTGWVARLSVSAGTAAPVPVFTGPAPGLDRFVLPDGRVRLGVLAPEPLPVLDSTDRWTFHLTGPNQLDRPVGTVAAPDPDAAGRLRVGVDETGTVRLFPVWPDYLPAATPAQVQDQPGTVLRVDIGCGTEPVTDIDNPFSGTH